jgi:hypothetical protein
MTSHRISSAARRAPANPEARGGAPAAAKADLLKDAPPTWAVRLTVGDHRLLTRFWSEHGKLCGHVYLESAWLPENESRFSENDHIQSVTGKIRAICNLESISLEFALIRGPGPAVLPVTRIVRY